jgi:hypothetical protein
MRISRNSLAATTLLLFVTAIFFSARVFESSVINAQDAREITFQGFEFGVTTPKIKYHFSRAKYKGSTFKGTWIAENVKEASPNYEIAAVEIKPGSQPIIEFSLSKPNGDWPKGQYRLEIRADGALAHTEKFLIQ